MTVQDNEIGHRGVPGGGYAFVRGHGTENDFVVIFEDPRTEELTPDRVRALCDRRAGLGGDGVLRVARTSALVEAGVVADPGVEGDPWFMDYRNADGSVAEMCGNGVRVFAHVLVATGRETGPSFDVATRAGVRSILDIVVRGDEAVVQVDMGVPRLLGTSTVRLGGREFTGRVVDVGNPHLACVVPGLDASELRRLPVDLPPELDPDVFGEGANVEIGTELAEGVCRMRVHERGAGETRSCGTGIVAYALAALEGADPAEVAVRVPGGTVEVAVADGRVRMTGPSRIVAVGRTGLADHGRAWDPGTAVPDWEPYDDQR